MLAVAIVGACGGDAELSSDLTPIPPQLALEPTIRIDGYAEDLVPIGRTALREDGLLAFTQGQDGKVLIYGAEGTRVGEFGREGSGPGEFTGLSYLGWVGDTLWVGDTRQNRLTYITLDPSPRLLRVQTINDLYPTSAGAELPAFQAGFLRGVFSDGSVLAQLRRPDSTRAAEFDGKTFFGRVTVDGTLVSEISRIDEDDPGIRMELSTPGAGVGTFSTTIMQMAAPWTLRHLVVSGPNADRTSEVVSVLNPDATVRIRVVRRAESDTLWVREIDLQGIPITRQRADSAVDATVNAFSGPALERFPDVPERYRSEVQMPDVIPPVLNALMGPDGSLWLEMDAVADLPPDTHMILDVQGELIGHVQVPDGDVVEVGRDFAWLSVTDSLGVTSLVRNRLIPGG